MFHYHEFPPRFAPGVSILLRTVSYVMTAKEMGSILKFLIDREREKRLANKCEYSFLVLVSMSLSESPGRKFSFSNVSYSVALMVNSCRLLCDFS